MSIDSSTSAADVLVIGCGLIGLACGAAAAERGFRVTIVGEPRAGAASLAAAGLLAPSIEREDGHASDFATLARDRYPAYLEWLRERTGLEVPLNRDGIIQVALNEAGVRGLQRAKPAGAEWLDARELAQLEPALSHGLGGVLHPMDGSVDNVRLFEALRAAVNGLARVTIVSDTITGLRFDGHVEAMGQSASRYSADAVVLAAGAWSSTITGLPRAIPVEPVRGQMLAYAGSPLRRAVYGPTGYVVPRTNGRTLVGATTERAGFESVTTPEGIARLARTAGEILPQFASSQPADAWAGLRPVSADLQPILGPDPEEPRLLYATGHSRNGILMTPITGECIGALLAGDSPPVEIRDFSITRFATHA
ncbi:MAG TPA: glycine oxidase ThiO [Gemmatimonadaceae bacterium]|nr:glycine oxidase ThiO [Gemmatimonadaceae bacterium]